jgi:hypothetical protein
MPIRKFVLKMTVLVVAAAGLGITQQGHAATATASVAASGMTGGVVDSSASRAMATRRDAGEVSSAVVLTITTPLTISYGQNVDGFANVTTGDGSTPTGTIVFYDGAQSICVLSVAPSGSCPASTGTGFTAGTHVLTAVYSGDAEHAGATSNAVTVTVLAEATTAGLTVSANPVAVGQSVVFTATVLGSSAVPAGAVTFMDGTSVLGTAALNASGVAVLATSSLAAGTHAVTAVYGASQNFAGASSAGVNEMVEASPGMAATATMLAASANPAASGQSVTFTATVAAVGKAPAPSGTVTFLDGAAVLGTGVLNSAGAATLTTATLGVGGHSVTASYAGEGSMAASVSGALLETVAGTGNGEFSVAVAGTPTVDAGHTTMLKVTVTPAVGFSQAVTLSCTNLPWEAACTFGQQTIPAGGGSTTLELSTFGPHDCGSNLPYFSSLPVAGPALAALLFFVPGRRRRWKGLLVALIAVCGMAGLSGCGNCTDLGTRPGTYSVKVIGTAAGGSAVASVVKMKVQVQ